MPSRLGHGLYKKIDRLKNIFRCIYIINWKAKASPTLMIPCTCMYVYNYVDMCVYEVIHHSHAQHKIMRMHACLYMYMYIKYLYYD